LAPLIKTFVSSHQITAWVSDDRGRGTESEGGSLDRVNECGVVVADGCNGDLGQVPPQVSADVLLAPKVAHR
jgi:hypothetical protein